MSIFTVTATKQIGPDDFKYKQLKIFAASHFQHIWNETELRGVSATGVARLEKFMATHADARITVNAGHHNPRLIGFTRGVSNHPNRSKSIKVGDVVRVKRRADHDTATVVANMSGDDRLVQISPPLFGHAVYPRGMLIRVPTNKYA